MTMTTGANLTDSLSWKLAGPRTHSYRVSCPCIGICMIVTTLRPSRDESYTAAAAWLRSSPPSHSRLGHPHCLHILPASASIDRTYTKRRLPGAEKKCLTTKTWNVDIATMSAASPRLKTVMRHCVDVTVDLLRWSRVRKSGTSPPRRRVSTMSTDGITKRRLTWPEPTLLCPLYAAQAPRQLVDALLQAGRLLDERRGLCRRDVPGLGLDHDVKVDELFREGRHVVSV